MLLERSVRISHSNLATTFLGVALMFGAIGYGIRYVSTPPQTVITCPAAPARTTTTVTVVTALSMQAPDLVACNPPERTGQVVCHLMAESRRGDRYKCHLHTDTCMGGSKQAVEANPGHTCIGALVCQPVQ